MHVDDCCISTDGSEAIEAVVSKLRDRFHFGSWAHAAKEENGGVDTGRRLKVTGNSIEVSLPEFVQGRLLEVDGKSLKGLAGTDPAPPLAKAEFSSGTGSLYWLSSPYRIDQCIATNYFQKAQHEATVDDAKELNRSIRETKQEEVALRVVPIHGAMAIGRWHDSALYGTRAELIEDDEDLERYDRHKVRSQVGVIFAAIPAQGLDTLDEIPNSILDWRPQAGHRVVIVKSRESDTARHCRTTHLEMGQARHMGSTNTYLVCAF